MIIVEAALCCLDLCSGTQSFVPVIAKVVALFAWQKAQSAVQVKMRIISQLISDISRVLEKLPRYFNDTAVSTFTISSLALLM